MTLRTDSEKFLMNPKLLAAAAFASLALSSCATRLDTTTTPYVAAPQLAPTEPAAVKIVRTEPLEPHDRLGEVMIDMSITYPPPIEMVEAKLAEESAKLGANGVVVVVDRVQPSDNYVTGPYWGRPMEIVTGRKAVGVAIKYK
ncbi:MAG TPA: hypothetical protein VL180_06350 [Burkholderiales bacterium]|nr:hypothetical protein [Burkholderiales bacterium]